MVTQNLDAGPHDFAVRLSLALKAFNLSRSQLSATLGVHKSLVSRWLSGKVTPTSYNLARISAVFAKVKPGFNMTLWTAPQQEFEAALGLNAAVQRSTEASRSPPVREIGAADAAATSAMVDPVVRGQRFAWAYRILAGAFVVALVLSGLVAWRTALRGYPAPEGQNMRGSQTASVAVMPFLNMSGDPGKEYLGDGISEEILNDLANTPKLRVASRTSSFSFKGKSADIAEIARKLNVDTVLEGSVRQQGPRLRIVGQLISATDGFHLWSASYDRDVKDVLAVQDEIARAIVAALAQKLLHNRDMPLAYHSPVRPRINPDAYTAYLRGRFVMNKGSSEDLLRAVDFFKQAIKLEPDYLDAHAILALTYVVLYSNGERRDTLGPARERVATALRLDPDNFTALLADAQIKRLSWQWNDADSAMGKLLRRYPSSAQVHHFHAILLEGLGLWDGSLVEQRRAAELDPFVPTYRDNVGQALHFLRRDNEAAVEYKRVLNLDSNFASSLGGICTYYADTGRLHEAEEILRDRLMPPYSKDPNAFMCAASIAYREQDRGKLEKISQRAEQLYRHGDLAAGWLPYPYAFMGEYDTAVRWLEKAYDDRDYGVFYAVRDPALPSAIVATPSWRALMQRPAFQEIARVRAQMMAQGG